ncbi:MAG: GGDEF domain-containing protein [Acidobacteria bacterium]|nr:GGDEF domain-containing protein [Acidobacteriota bacterium]
MQDTALLGLDVAIAVGLAIAVWATARITSRRWKVFWLVPFVTYAAATLLQGALLSWRPFDFVRWRSVLDVAVLVALYIAIVEGGASPRTSRLVRTAVAAPILAAIAAVVLRPERISSFVAVAIQLVVAAAAIRELYRTLGRTRGRSLQTVAVGLFPVAAAAALSPIAPAAAPLRCVALLLAGAAAISIVVEDRIVSLAAEVENLLAQQHQLAQLAEVDPLTGCANRHALRTWLDNWDEQEPITLMVLDVDNLKSINDRHGHAAGYVALQMVANVLRDAVRADDLVVRWGGDEFVAILTATGENTAMNRFGHLVRLLTHAADNFAYDAPLRASWGVASCSSRDEAAEALHEADRRMYAMKRQRRREG